MKKFRKNNKGFSLVELIIVIAIMAALVAILAPQYLKYVERSRESADQTQIDEIIRAVEITLADPDNTAYPTSVTISDRDGEGKATISSEGPGADAFDTALKAALGSLDVTFKSKEMLTTTNTDITMTIDANNFTVYIDGAPAAWNINRDS